MWDRAKDSGAFLQTAKFTAHSGSIWRIDWAPPEYGHLLATCSYDKTALVWEETVGPDGIATWVERKKFLDNRAAVMDVAFAPRHLGLCVVRRCCLPKAYSVLAPHTPQATACLDGWVRVFTADNPMDLTDFSSVKSFQAWEVRIPAYWAASDARRCRARRAVP